MKFRKKILIALIVIWVAVIWGHSMMSGEGSSAESSFVEKLLRPVFELFVGKGNVTPHLVRKTGHFTEYMILGALSASLLKALGKLRPFFMSYAFFGGVAVAVADETIQIFSDGRGPAVTDVLIDSGGMLTGILLLSAAFLIAGGISERRRKAKTE